MKNYSILYFNNNDKMWHEAIKGDTLITHLKTACLIAGLYLSKGYKIRIWEENPENLFTGEQKLIIERG